MLFQTAGQGPIFCVMCAAGALVALWYDVCRQVRNLLAAGPLLSLAADAAFGLGAAAVFCGAAVAANYGAVRLYMVLAALLGWFLYAAGPGHALRQGARRLCRGLRRALRRMKDNRIIKVIFR